MREEPDRPSVRTTIIARPSAIQNFRFLSASIYAIGLSPKIVQAASIMMKSARQKLATGIGLGPAFFIWFILAWLLLGFSRLLIIMLPFSRLTKLFGVHSGLDPQMPICTRDQEARARSIRKATGVAAKYAFWRSDCLPQALTARFLLGLRSVPYAMFLGVNRGETDMKLIAHAWIVSGRVFVAGGAGFNRYKSVGCFVSKPGFELHTKSPNH